MQFITLEKGGPRCDIPAEKQEGVPTTWGETIREGAKLKKQNPGVLHS